MTCPNCGSAEISPLTNRCELCGFAPGGSVAVEAPRAETVDDVARQELTEQFRFDAPLGHGPASAVYLAREHGSDREIVVKVLPRPVDRRPEVDERFRTAVEAVAALEHPHIVPVFDHGLTEHLYWYSMEHVRGRSLRSTLHSRGPLDLKPCQRIIAQVASALDYAHRRGIMHGALKPENVLIDPEGWVHVCDLFVTLTMAKLPSAGRPALPAPPAEEAPKPARSPYASPEELHTPVSDQYALGVLVYECLTGSPPPESDAAPAASLATLRPDVPAHVMHAVRRALSPKPIDRFPSVLDLVAALETYAPSALDARPSGRGSGVVLVQTDWKAPPRPFGWRRLVGTAAAIAAIAVLAGPLRPNAMRLWRRVLNRPQSADVSLVADSAVRREADTTPRVASAPPAPRPAARPSSTTGRQRLPARETRQERTRATPVAAPATPAPPAPVPSGEGGRLFVSATPWGQLFVDGQLVGNTPKANLSLAPGAHVIRVVREGYEPFERTIQVTPSQVVRITDIVLAARRP